MMVTATLLYDDDNKNTENTKNTSLFIARNKILVSGPSELQCPTQLPAEKSCYSLKSLALYSKGL